MIRIYIITLFIIISAVSCKNKEKVAEAKADGGSKQEEKAKGKSAEEGETEEDTTAQEAFSPEPIDYPENVIAGIKKTPCFGQCPVYRMWIYEDMTVEYEGKYHVEKKGLYRSKATEEQYQNLLAFAKSIGYFEFDDAYTKPVTDVPTVYTTMVDENGNRKSVINHFMGPEALTEFENYFEQLFSENDWEKVEQEKGTNH